jgi:hypothetical protein
VPLDGCGDKGPVHVILYIAWKQEWTTYHMENFTQGFRVMPEESSAGAVPKPSRQGEGTVQVHHSQGLEGPGPGLPAPGHLPA